MRELHGHKINEANKALRIVALDEVDSDKPRGTTYLIDIFPTSTGAVSKDSPSTIALPFHKGDVSKGVNGITLEALFECGLDKLRLHQAGPFAHPANAKAIECVQEALDALRLRTAERMERGVEGPHTV
jgi:hypothetical protein